MKKKSAQENEDNKSLKTFVLYAVAVLGVILIAVCIKAFFVFQQSTFDGQSQYTLAVAKNDLVEEVIAFNPTADSIHVLKVENSQIPVASLGKFLTVIPDSTVVVPDDYEITTDVNKVVSDIGFKYSFMKSDATIIDIVRLGLFSKNVPLGNRVIESKTFSKEEIDQERGIDKQISDLFIDTQLSTENVSIQIINGSGVSGMGSRLERVLVNLGANVVSVTSSRSEEPKSAVKYFGEESYTLKRLERLLEFPVTKLEKETIANIVITIGVDSISTTKF